MEKFRSRSKTMQMTDIKTELTTDVENCLTYIYVHLLTGIQHLQGVNPKKPKP